jgi:glycosyltransferase involved in cell wall biosynthesis
MAAEGGVSRGHPPNHLWIGRGEHRMNGKKISILVPTFNEEENVVALSEAVLAVLSKDLPEYDYELIFIDNCSTDRTQELLQLLCRGNPKIKAIFNAKNFGQFNSPYYGLLQTTGDCTVLLCADFQDPVELIPRFVREWEDGYRIVIGIKTSSRENRLMYFLRSCYYKLIKKFSDVEQIEHFTGFGLYDKSFIDTLRNLDDPTPFLRGIVAELGPQRKEIPYEQARRRAGKTSNNWYRLYDAAMLSFTSYTKIGLRLATILGFVFSAASLLVAFVYLVLKLIMWDSFPIGTAPILIGLFVIGSIQLFFIGLMGEYILNINTRVMKRPLVIEEKRLNFDARADVAKEEEPPDCGL